MKNGINLNKVAGWVLAFIGSLVLVMTVSLAIIKFTLFNGHYMLHVANKVEYSQNMAKEINDTITDLGRGSSVPPKVLQHTVSKDLVQQDFENYVTAIYSGQTFTAANQNVVANKVVESVKNYANEIGQTLDEDTVTNIDTLGKEAGKRYTSLIAIPYLSVYAQKVMAYNGHIWILLIITAGIFILLLLGGMSLASRLKHRKLRYLATIFNGAGLMLLVFPGYLYFSKLFYRLGISSKTLYDFLTTYVNGFIAMFLWAGLISLIIGAGLFIWSEQKRKKLIHH